MQIKEALYIAADKLNLYFISSRHLEARILLSKVLEQPIEYLLLNYEQVITKEEEEFFFMLIERRKRYEPIAYIVEYKEFYSRIFKINKDVVIPRAETEILIEMAIEEYKKFYKNSHIDILDLGTGSGIISITLALEITNSSIIAVDNSSVALQIANLNVNRYNLEKQINNIKSNWYQNLGKKYFDFIISNPPYINPLEKKLMARETLLYEPQNALYAKNNGLESYEQIIKGAKQYLRSSGALFLEIGFNQFDDIYNILKLNNFVVILVQKDLQGYIRAIAAKNII